MILRKLRKLTSGHSRGADSPDGILSPDVTLPDLSNLLRVGRMRHIQSLYERGDRRNPDILVGDLLGADDYQRCARLNLRELDKMRAGPFYYHLVARTKYYDEVVLEAVAAGIRRVLILGSGSDTRLYRFGGHLATHGVDVAECDQPDAIAMKAQLARSLPHAARVQYIPADLNLPQTWAALWSWIDHEPRRQTLVYAEGVSPYVLTSAFEQFLGQLASRLETGSQVAYDFKHPGVAPDSDLGENAPNLYRVPLDQSSAAARHERLGFERTSIVLPEALMNKYLPSWDVNVSALYEEDAALRLWL